MNVGWREHYYDSCHKHEGCRIDYFLVPMSDICNCKLFTKIII